ncbi:MAG: hypothetical protein EZS28_042956 [Streblomastix strix]|uniref:Uncharacterized protein n=1 Tax=Streblomastix strix TaxID=222440 RepID=A0A5J4TTF6_9EUKA|nr:MAG: hypothetical protein EZS28_042956 [Streblomastix strix]
MNSPYLRVYILNLLEAPSTWSRDWIYKGGKHYFANKWDNSLTDPKSSYYVVTFYRVDSRVISIQYVYENQAAQDPRDREGDRDLIAHIGYNFLGWGAVFTNITDDLDVWGIYQNKITGEDEQSLFYNNNFQDFNFR